MNNRTGARSRNQALEVLELSPACDVAEALGTDLVGPSSARSALCGASLGGQVFAQADSCGVGLGEHELGGSVLPGEDLSDERFIDERFIDENLVGAGTGAAEEASTADRGDDRLSAKKIMSDSVVAAQVEADRALARQACWLADIYALTVADARRRGLDPGVLLRGVHAELGRELQISERTVARRMNTAERLVRTLPETLVSWSDGMLTQRHIEMVVNESVGLSAEALPTWEAQVLAEQRRKGLTPAQLRVYARSLRETAEPQTMIERHHRARSERHLVIEPADDGMAWLSALMPAVEAVGIYQRIRAIAKHTQTVNGRQGGAAAGNPADLQPSLQGDDARGDDRTFSQLQVDVLRDLLIHGTVTGVESPDVAEFHGQLLSATGDREAASHVEIASRTEAARPNAADRWRKGSQRTKASLPSATERLPNPEPGLGSGISAQVTVTVPMMVLVNGAQNQSRQTPASAEVTLGPDKIVDSPVGRTSVPASPAVPAAATDVTNAAGAAGFAWLDGYGPIDDETALELVAGCDDLRRMLTDPVSGVALTYGRKTYRPPASLAAYVRDRDQTCRFPGCSTEASVCEIDHTLDWQFDGPTDATNLACLCRRHHVVKHHAAWKASHIDEHGTLLWTTPTGQTYVTAPQPADRSLTSRTAESVAQRPAFIDQSDGTAPF